MDKGGLGKWLGRLCGAATFVYIAALCLAVAVLVIAVIPGSPVRLELPTSLLSGLERVGGVASGVVVDATGTLMVRVSDPSLAQRLTYLATTLPGLLLVADVGRRMARLLRAAQDEDPFITSTARQLTTLAKITAFGGVGVWAVSEIAKWVLSASVLSSGTTLKQSGTPLAWLAVGLIFAAFAQLVARGVDMRTELDTVI